MQVRSGHRRGERRGQQREGMQGMRGPSAPTAGRAPMIVLALLAMGMLLVISLIQMHKAGAMQSTGGTQPGQFQMLYNQWGTHDHNEHWGGVGSENYHTARYDATGSNAGYHPRDSSSGDGDAMEPAWWRQGPGANSEYTGHAMDGELYSPPDQQIFKPFFMKQRGGARATQLYDLDGPQPTDAPPSSWARAGQGTAAWMLAHEGPLLAQQQEGRQETNTPEQDTTAMRVRKAEQLLRAHHGKARHASHVQRSRRARAAPARAYSVDGSGDIDSMSFRQRIHVQAGAKVRQHRTLHHRHLAPSRKRAHGHANKNPDTPTRPSKHIAAWTADVDARAIFKRDKDLLAHPWQAHVQA